jgi:formate hydrogenlyase subunit 3/multisubunit Na+/H+ antiporter MnhD subunit
MEILFAGSMVALLVDIVGSAYGVLRRFGAAVVAALAVASSLVIIAMDWESSLGGTVNLQPVADSFASLYLADKYTTFTAFTVLVVGLAVIAYSVRYFEGGRRGPFYALLSALMCTAVGVVSAGDLLTLFLFWEGMTITAFGLVTYGRSELSMEAGVKYFLMAGAGSLLALWGMAAVYFSAGTIQLQAIPLALGSSFGQLGFFVLLIGLGVEAAIVPMHTWLPDVYSASSIPTASVMSGAVTGVGVFALLKVVQPLAIAPGYLPLHPPDITQAISNLHYVIAFLAVLTMLVGNFAALRQANLRRILSFSSITQTGYMLAALSTLTVAGLVAVVFTIWNHGLLKSNFFMVLGKENASMEGSQLESLTGAGRSDRRLGFLYGSSSLAMMGAPPFGMFWSEILVVQSLLLAAQTSGSIFYVLAAAVVLNIVLSIGYYFRIINTIVFGETKEATEKRPLADLLPPVSLLALSVATGVAPFLILGQVL